MLFDARNLYHRYMLHYESDDQISLPEIIAKGSIDADTAGLLWYLIEQRASFIIAGPTDPTPGVGKTTTLNALLPFYPAGTGFIYTIGMYEQYDFLQETEPSTTTVLANEVSDHLRIYTWGNKARRLFSLPAQGYAVATTCHADTLAEVLTMLTHDLRIPVADIEQVQFIVNIGLRGRGWPSKRRWLTTHFILPSSSEADAKKGPIVTEPLACWENAHDTFSTPTERALDAMATWVGVPRTELLAAVATRAACLRELADEQADQSATIAAIDTFRARQK